jgi:uncharacterized membrane protein YhaH (DUF805 family)
MVGDMLGKEITVKFLLEAIVAVVLHPLAVILAWINLAGRRDLGRSRKLIWAFTCMIWGLGPILYMLLDDGSLW